MKKADVHVGGVYVVKVSGRLAQVRLDRESLYGGWEATNLDTGRAVRVRTAGRLRYDARGARATSDTSATTFDSARATRPDTRTLTPPERSIESGK